MDENNEGARVTLDGRPVKTPHGAILTLPSRALAAAVAGEWQSVGTHVDYETMPLTRLGFAAIDRMADRLDETIVEALRYAGTDTVCFPSEYPQALIEREQAAWLPVLAWIEVDLGLVFQQNLTLVHQPQPQATLERLEATIRAMSPHDRAGLMAAVPLFGSVVLALALWRGQLTGGAAFAASRVGEIFQAETWGDDAEAAQRTEAMKVLAVSLQVWFEGLRQG